MKDVSLEINLADLIERLFIVSHRIWALEDEIRQGGEGKYSKEEIGRRALLIRDFNKERLAYKNAINKIEEKYFPDVKVDHRSAYEENNNSFDKDEKQPRLPKEFKFRYNKKLKTVNIFYKGIEFCPIKALNKIYHHKSTTAS